MMASVVALTGVGIILVGQWRSSMGPTALQGTAAVLGSAFCYAFNIVLMRRQALVAGPVEVAFSQSLVVAILLSLGGPLFASLPDVPHVPLIMLASLLAVASLLLLAWAYARGEANFLSPSEYTSFVWASLFGWLVFGEAVAPATAVGTAFIIAGCVVAARQRPSALVAIEAQI